MTDESLRDASRRNAQSSRPPRSMMSSTAAALKPKPDCICRCSIRFLQPCGNVYIISYFQPKRAPNSRMAQYIPYSAICRLGDTHKRPLQHIYYAERRLTSSAASSISRGRKPPVYNPSSFRAGMMASKKPVPSTDGARHPS